MAYGQGNFRGGNNRSPNTYGGGQSWKGGFGANKPSFPARCDQCGNSCTVPFRPNGSKPVLCRDCFRGSEGGFQENRFDRKPAFGRFDDRGTARPPRRPTPGPAPVGPSLKSEIQSVNRKLDQILAILNDATIEAQEEDEVDETAQTEVTDIE